MVEQTFKTIQENEISLKDIINFLIEFWQPIFFAGMFGVFFATIYLWITPSQYQAIAQIQMAQLSPDNSNRNNNLMGINVEDPKLLLVRLRLPTTYTNAEINACGLNDQKSPSKKLLDFVHFSEIKAVGSVIELRTHGLTKEIASVCAYALFKNIQASQNEIRKLYIKEAKILLASYRDRLDSAQKFIAKEDQSVQLLSAAYLSSRDEVRFLADEIFRLNALIVSGDLRQTKLISPIYVENDPIFPKKVITLITGLIIGLSLGLFLIFGKRSYATYKARSYL